MLSMMGWVVLHIEFAVLMAMSLEAIYKQPVPDNLLQEEKYSYIST